MKQSFVCYGSYPAHILTASLPIDLDRAAPGTTTVYDDINITHGTSGDDLKRGNVYQKLDLKLGGEVNLVTFESLNADLLLQSADINAVAAVVEVTVDNEQVTNTLWKVESPLWAFLLEDQTLRILKTDNPAQTFVRVAFKAFSNDLPFDLGAVDPQYGHLYKAQLDKMKSLEEKKWSANPLKQYAVQQYKKVHKLVRKVCSQEGCGKKNNVLCPQRMCSNCCAKSGQKCAQHKHTKAAKKRSAAEPAPI